MKDIYESSRCRRKPSEGCPGVLPERATNCRYEGDPGRFLSVYNPLGLLIRAEGKEKDKKKEERSMLSSHPFYAEDWNCIESKNH